MFPVRNRSAWIGAAAFAMVVAVGLAAPLLATTDPARIDPTSRNKRPGAERTLRNDDGSTTTGRYWMGTDTLGRDVYSRVIYGARVSLVVGVTVALLSMAAGLVIGLVSGYLRGLDGFVRGTGEGSISSPVPRQRSQ